MGAARRLSRKGLLPQPLGAVALALSLATSPALAAAPAPEQRPIPAECGSRAVFESELRQRLGSDTPLDGVHVSITRAPTHFHLRVEIDGELRELDDESCSELFRASIVIAMSMLLHEEQRPAASSESEREPPPQPSAPRPRFTLGAGVGINVGTLPAPVLALELESKALWPRWGVGLGLRYLAPGETSESQPRAVRFQALGAHLAGIFRAAPVLEAQLGFGAQYLMGESLDAAAAQTGGAWVAGPTLGLTFIPLQSGLFWAGLGAEGQLNLIRGDFEILNYNGPVYDVSWLAGSGFVRLGLIW
ncbi:MAG TPA: hypothetical protein VIW29_02225 [Polyangiaceae bacterium]